jgi:gluconate 2-dehydrogenase gamma chain
MRNNKGRWRVNKKQQSRRQFLKDSSAAMGLTLAGIHLPSLLPLGEAAAKARDNQAAMQILSAEEAADIEAITSMVIPSGETPGAREAGVVYFIDLALGAQLASMLVPLRHQLSEMNAFAGSDSAGGFARLDEAARITVMEKADSAGFLGIFSTLTMFGMFSMPSYGGNRDHVGWEMIGFDHRHAWMPPFGYYDAEEHAGRAGGQSNETS